MGRGHRGMFYNNASLKRSGVRLVIDTAFEIGKGTIVADRCVGVQRRKGTVSKRPIPEKNLIREGISKGLATSGAERSFRLRVAGDRHTCRRWGKELPSNQNLRAPHEGGVKSL